MLTAAGYAATSTEYYRDLWKLLFYFCLVIIFFVLIAIFYVYYEGWTVNETLFFMIFTLSTVGYGTPSPTDDYSRLFTIFFIIICIGIIFSGISDLIHNHITWLQTVCCKSSSQQVAEDIVIGDIYHYRKQLVWYLMILLSWIMIGSVVLKYNEEWTWVTAIYYMVQTTTTVGYGDLRLQHHSSMSFVVFYIIVSTLLVASAIRIFNATLLESSELDATELKLYKLGTVENIRDSLGYERENSSFHRGEASRVNDEGASHAEVVLGVLAHVGVLDHHRDIEPWLKKLRELDEASTGRLSLEQFKIFCEKENFLASKQLLDLQEARQKSVLLSLCERRQAGWNIEPVAGRPSGEVIDEENEMNDREEQMDDIEDGIRLLDRNSDNQSVSSPLQNINGNTATASTNGKVSFKSAPAIAPPPGHISSRSVSTSESIHSPSEASNPPNSQPLKPANTSAESKEKTL